MYMYKTVKSCCFVFQDKKYKSAAEETRRKQIFSENLDEIEAHNLLYKKGQKSFELGINPFTDMVRTKTTTSATIASSSSSSYYYYDHYDNSDYYDYRHRRYHHLYRHRHRHRHRRRHHHHYHHLYYHYYHYYHHHHYYHCY